MWAPFFANFEEEEGRHEITKVRGHATAAAVSSGEVPLWQQKGNKAADKYAKLGAESAVPEGARDLGYALGLIVQQASLWTGWVHATMAKREMWDHVQLEEVRREELEVEPDLDGRAELWTAGERAEAIPHALPPPRLDPLVVQQHDIVQRQVLGTGGGSLIYCSKCATYATKVIRADGFPAPCSKRPIGRQADMERLERGVHPDRHKRDVKLGPPIMVNDAWRQVLTRRIKEVTGQELTLHRSASSGDAPQVLSRRMALLHYGVKEAELGELLEWGRAVRERKRRAKKASEAYSDPEDSGSDS